MSGKYRGMRERVLAGCVSTQHLSRPKVKVKIVHLQVSAARSLATSASSQSRAGPRVLITGGLGQLGTGLARELGCPHTEEESMVRCVKYHRTVDQIIKAHELYR